MAKECFRAKTLAHAPAVVLVAAMVGAWFGLVKSPRSTRSGGVPPIPLTPVEFSGQLRGSPDAPIGVMMFSEFQCPFCGRFARDTFPELDRAYVQQGRVELAFRQFPLEQIHAFAAEAAAVGACAGKSGRFWDYHDAMFAQQNQLDAQLPWSVAASLGVNVATLKRCVAEDGALAVRGDVQLGNALSVSGTPAFFIGRLQADKLFVTNVLVGARPLSDFTDAIDAAQNGLVTR